LWLSFNVFLPNYPRDARRDHAKTQRAAREEGELKKQGAGEAGGRGKFWKLVDHPANMQPQNSLMEFKDSLMEIKGSLMEFKGSLMEFRGSLMEFKGSLMEFKGSLMEFRGSTRRMPNAQ
jgi:hypothetical protein